jgi:hypothetical protein
MAKTTVEVPDEWADAAEEMDISLAEYCRRMARVGRRRGSVVKTHTETERAAEYDSVQGFDGDGMKQLVYEYLTEDCGRDTRDLLDAIEDDIGEAADELVSAGRAKYRRSQGGWLRATDE